ncbi:MAG TPA: hypothetical protein VHE30_19770 [Polyangiaceae bacterium]|nr:hypothetical protein [Polyangiaceae bacterium]
MNRSLRFLLAAGSVSGAALSFSGCVENESTLFVHGVLLAKPPDCIVTPDPGQLTLGSGVLDIALARSYRAALLVGNQFAPRGAKTQLKTETTRVILTGAEVTLTDSATGEVFNCPSQPNCGQYSVYGSGFADSSRSEDPGWGIVFAQLVPNAVGEAIAADTGNPILSDRTKTIGLVATIKVFGRSLGGKDVESGDFSFPIDVCNRCLIDYSHADTAGACLTPTGFEGDKICQPGQDQTVDCRACTSLDVCKSAL